nr:O-antigen ligase family protein [Aquabacterium sp. A08]
MTLVAFVSHSFWVFALVVALVLALKRPPLGQVVGVWFLLMFVVPAASVNIPGFGLINYLFALNHLRLLSLVLLLPAAWVLLQQRGNMRLGSTWPDKLLLAYLCMAAVLQLREANITSTLRGCLYLFTDVFLPYYVASRSLRSLDDFRHALTGFLVAALLLGVLAMFETLRHWNLYSALVGALGLQSGFGGYLARDGMQRAAASAGQPIPLGMVMAVSMGFFLYLRQQVTPRQRLLGWLVLAGGLAASLSRGPWVGAVFTVVVFLALGPKPVKQLLGVALLGALALPALALFPAGQKVLNLLPFIGQVDESNVTYRQRLLDNAWLVIERHPWFGSVDYLQTPEMLSMVQGQGIIDIVNTYIGVALDHGLVGLGLFGCFFSMAGLSVFKSLRQAKEPEPRLLGRALLATLAGLLLTIFTVSSITIIPWMYWTLAGVCVAYANRPKPPLKTQEETYAREA